MATPYKIQVGPENTGLLGFKQSEAVASKATELLQRDLETHAALYHDRGLHNHTVHQILALFGTGSGSEWIIKGYDYQNEYQRPPPAKHNSLADDLGNWTTAKQYLGQPGYYSDFLVFYQREIERLGGWEACLKEHVFKGDERAEDLYVRLFGGLLHPLIQLMYGVEWAQPAIVAEALAQAAIHPDTLRGFLHGAEAGSRQSGEKTPPLIDLLEEVKEDRKLATAVRYDDPNKIQDGILARAHDSAIKFGSKVRVDADMLEERTAEMFHLAVYIGACAAFHPPKDPKFDFFYMHHINFSPFYVTLNKLPWLETSHKVRLLEWKIRLNLIEFVARGCPTLRFDQLTTYTPENSVTVGSPEDLLPAVHKIEDDGHSIKLARAIVICKNIMGKFENAPWAKIRGDMWLKVMHLVADSTQVQEGIPQWVRGCGFEEAWTESPDRS